MFTGLVEMTATVRGLVRRGPEARIDLAVTFDESPALGDSISINGVCLTVVDLAAHGFAADVSKETLDCTTLGALAQGSEVNVERSVALGQRMGGHIVLGHVDGVGQVREFAAVKDAKRLVVEAPPTLQRYLASKGSVALDGVSLTINRLTTDGGFEVMLVPHTLEKTTLSALAPGARLNVEADVLARYVARQLDYAGVTSPVDGDARMMEKLQDGGFV